MYLFRELRQLFLSLKELVDINQYNKTRNKYPLNSEDLAQELEVSKENLNFQDDNWLSPSNGLKIYTDPDLRDLYLLVLTTLVRYLRIYH